ncbi:MAG: Tfp pilus assembly protein PilF [Pseudohongiellaceae bacterium]|jgi:Tfp pilus assembly protein PilF
MVLSTFSATPLLLILALAGAASPLEASPTEPAAPLWVPLTSLRADLPGRALGLAHQALPLQAYDLLSTELLGSLAQGDWSDERRRAEAEVAALILVNLTAKLDLWRETAELLAAAGPWPDNTPPQVAFLLDHLEAKCWSRVGKTDRARGLINGLGYVTDWYLAGPFDNERGAGFETVYEPELTFDRSVAMEGKERLVSWRLNPGRQHPLARLRLDQMLRPRKQAVAYLATAVQAQAARTVVLRFGTETSFKVFLNGREVASRKVERPFALDQERVALQLSEGWNQLLVKLAVEDGSWSFESRFTDLGGRPLVDLECQSAFTAWPDPPPHEDFIPWWELEGAGWSVDLLAALPGDQVVPEGDHDGHDHSEDGAGPEEAGGGGEAPDGEGGGDEGGGDDDFSGWGDPPPPPPADWTWPRPAPMGPRPVLAREAVDILPELTDAPGLRQATVWHLLVHPDDVVDRTARGFAELAAELSPDDAMAHYLVALANDAEGASANEREVNRRQHALQRAVALDPAHGPALLALAAFVIHDNPIPQRANSLLQRAMAASPQSWDVLTARADFLADHQRAGEADNLMRQAEDSAEGATRTAGLLSRAGRLHGLGLPDAALQLLKEGYSRDTGSRYLADLLIDNLIDAGEVAQALYYTERSLQVEPFDVRRMLRSASRLEVAGGNSVNRARELVTRALDVCPENTAALADLVRIDVGLGEEDKAARVLAEIVRLDAGDDHARRHLSLLTAAEDERFEEPYRRDAGVLLSLPLPEGGNEAFEVLDRTVVWRVHPDGTEHSYKHTVLRVLNQAGVKRLDTWTLAGNGAARIKVYGVRVIHADGTIEHAPAPRWRRGGYRAYDLPPLIPGDLVDVEYRADQVSADVFGEYFGLRHEFYLDRLDGLAPVRRSELVVIAPEGVPLHVATRNADDVESSTHVDDAGHRVYRWVARDLQRPDIEGFMPDRGEFGPVVDVTTFESWESFASWWWDFIEKEFVTTNAMREKVAELVEGKSTELEKVEAIARFVGQEIRYNAWAFGTHGYEPYSASTIFERRFGDCKDKSILLRQLLAEIDVEAIPVLINAEYYRADEPLESAMIGLFNHCIAYLPATDERDGYYLDATADLNPVDYLRADDQGARVLHVDHGKGTLHDIPYAPAIENALRRAYDVTLSETGSARVEFVDESNGRYGVGLRTRYGGEQGDIERKLSQQFAGSFGAIDVIDVEASDLEDITELPRLAIVFEADEFWTSDGEWRTLAVSPDPLGLESLAQERPADREFELVLDRPFRSRTEVLYRLPEGIAEVELPQLAEIALPGLIDYTLKSERVPEGIRVVRDFSLHVRRVGLSDYEAFRDAVRDIGQAESRVLRVRPESVD